MDCISPTIEDVDSGIHRPEPSLEDKFVSSYLEDRSEVYRDLVKVKDDVWNNPQATAYFRWQRDKADNSNFKDRKAFFNMMRWIGDEMDTASNGALSLPHSNARVLDLCMAPGGYTAAVLKHSSHAVVCAFTLPLALGGHQIIHRQDSRLSRKFGDITMLYRELRVTDIPQDHPKFSNLDDRRLWGDKEFDLVFCDGQALRTHELHIADYRRQVEAVRLTVSQLMLAMQRIEGGGTLIMLLHDVGSYETIKILSVFDEIAEIQLFKPVTSHNKKGSFYLIAKNVQPGRPEAVAAVNEWKTVWKDLTFPKIDQGGQEETPEVAREPELAGEVSDLLENFGKRVIELGEPVWQLQKDALATARWTKKKKRATGDEQVDTGEASTAAIDNATLAVHDSKEDLDDFGDADDVDTAPVLRGLSDSVDVSVAMGNLEIDS